MQIVVKWLHVYNIATHMYDSSSFYSWAKKYFNTGGLHVSSRPRLHALPDVRFQQYGPPVAPAARGLRALPASRDR